MSQIIHSQACGRSWQGSSGSHGFVSTVLPRPERVKKFTKTFMCFYLLNKNLQYGKWTKKELELTDRIRQTRPRTEAHACHESRLHGYPQLQIEFQASLGYQKPWGGDTKQNTKKQNKTKTEQQSGRGEEKEDRNYCYSLRYRSMVECVLTCTWPWVSLSASRVGSQLDSLMCRDVHCGHLRLLTERLLKVHNPFSTQWKYLQKAKKRSWIKVSSLGSYPSENLQVFKILLPISLDSAYVSSSSLAQFQGRTIYQRLPITYTNQYIRDRDIPFPGR